MKSISIYRKLFGFATLITLFANVSFGYDIPTHVFNVTSSATDFLDAPIGNIKENNDAAQITEQKSEFYIVAIEPDSLDSLYAHIHIDLDTGSIYAKHKLDPLSINFFKFSALSINDGSAITIVINVLKNPESTTPSIVSTSIATTSTKSAKTTKQTTKTTTTKTTTTTSTIASTKGITQFNNRCFNLNKIKWEQTVSTRLDQDLITDSNLAIENYKCYLIDNSHSNATLSIKKILIQNELDFFALNQLTGLILIDCDYASSQISEDKLMYIQEQDEVDRFYKFYLKNKASGKKQNNQSGTNLVWSNVVIDGGLDTSGFMLTRQVAVNFKCSSSAYTKSFTYNLKVKNEELYYMNNLVVMSDSLNEFNRSGILLFLIVKSPTQLTQPTRSMTTIETITATTTSSTTALLASMATKLTDFTKKTISPTRRANSSYNLAMLILIVTLFLIGLFISFSLSVVVFKKILLSSHEQQSEKADQTSGETKCLPNPFKRDKKLNSALSTNTMETRTSSIISASSKSSLNLNNQCANNLNNSEQQTPFATNESRCSNKSKRKTQPNSNSLLVDANNVNTMFSGLPINNYMHDSNLHNIPLDEDVNGVLSTYHFDPSNAFLRNSSLYEQNFMIQQQQQQQQNTHIQQSANYVNDLSLYRWCNMLDWKLEYNALANVMDDLSQLK